VTAASDDVVRVGLVLREGDLLDWQGRLDRLAALAVDAGLDHLAVGDHVSFAGGHGTDGLIRATALLAAHPTISVQTAVYLLALRHPAVVARQLSTLALIAPGRFCFGVGVGGDDRRELELCGVDARTRGARTDEALQLLRALLTGEEVTFHGQFFAVDAGAIRPAPQPPVPILVGGRADAAADRTGRLGDGWIGVWVSPRRFTEMSQRVAAAARAAARPPQPWQHTLQLWAGIGASGHEGIARVKPVMERAYGLPFERFARYTPCGDVHDLAKALEPYLAGGCRRFNFVPEAPNLEVAIETIGAVKRSLADRCGSIRLDPNDFNSL
jgi:alkanesulfonate monooxygenase SsuD/methylene tetrahydromethanopterin reductase-like flavin-dependent oxidoreductase (luciferase family)